MHISMFILLVAVFICVPCYWLCRSSDFLPLEYSRLSGLEEKIFSEQQTLKGLSRQEAQEAYISACTALPTYGTIFFPCKVRRYSCTCTCTCTMSCNIT